jgi:hypothetical protein
MVHHDRQPVKRSFLPIKLRIFPKQSHREFQPPLTSHIFLQALFFLDTGIKLAHQKRVIILPSLALFGKCKMEPIGATTPDQ